MPATIVKLKIADPDVRGQIQRIISMETVTLSSDCRISVIEDQVNEKWELIIEKPDGINVSSTLYGALGEHQPGRFRMRLSEVLSAVGQEFGRDPLIRRSNLP